MLGLKRELVQVLFNMEWLMESQFKIYLYSK